MLLLFTSGCYYDQVLPVEPEGEISYSMDMQPYFDSKCVTCHNGTGVPLNLTPSVSYDELMSGGYVNTTDPTSSLLYTKIAPGGSMEQYSSSTETAMTLKWIEQGAKNN
jgi:hypothetical protein